MKNKIIEKQTYEDLLSILSSDEFITSTQIIKNLPDTKNGSYLREIINTLRSNGYPIISSNSGYKLSNDRAEILGCIQTLQSRVSKINNASSGMMLYVNNYNA